mgnify:CR=1 FL=1
MKLDYKEVNNMNLLPLLDQTDSEHVKKFVAYPHGEHYKLLAYMVSKFFGKIIFDVGTHHGGSALALAYNPSNKIVSYDVYAQSKILDAPNIELNIGNVLDDKRLLDASIILLDTTHDGIFEREFLNHLINKGYQGFLILDDIYLNNEMREFWAGITIEKHDITALGHWSGTGLVNFGNEKVEIQLPDDEVLCQRLLDNLRRDPIYEMQNLARTLGLHPKVGQFLAESVMIRVELERRGQLK